MHNHHLIKVTEPLGGEDQRQIRSLWERYKGASGRKEVKVKGKTMLVLKDKKRGEKVLSRYPGAGGSTVELLGKHMDRMNIGEWLFDEVINMYMWLLQVRDDKSTLLQKMPNGEKAKPSHYFNSFFFEKLDTATKQHGSLGSMGAVMEMNRLADRINSVGGNIFLLDKLVIPVNCGGTHWTLCVANFKKKQLQYYDSYHDSMGGTGGRWVAMLREFLAVQARRWRGELPCGFTDIEWRSLLDIESWRDTIPRSTPQQGNCCDCGAFVCAFASFIMQRIEENFPFSQADADRIRERITYDLMNAHSTEI